jgi:hypothetical protein
MEWGPRVHKRGRRRNSNRGAAADPRRPPFPRCAYFQPASLSQAAISVGCVFSQADTDKVSLDDIFPFMHEQYAATTSGVAPSLLLSLTHFLIQAASSASARAGVMTEVKLIPLRTVAKNNAEIAFIDISSKEVEVSVRRPTVGRINHHNITVGAEYTENQEIKSKIKGRCPFKHRFNDVPESPSIEFYSPMICSHHNGNGRNPPPQPIASAKVGSGA